MIENGACVLRASLIRILKNDPVLVKIRRIVGYNVVKELIVIN